MSKDSFVKTPGGAVINTSIEEFENYKRLRKRLSREKELENQVSTLQTELSDLKKLIQDISSRIP